MITRSQLAKIFPTAMFALFLVAALPASADPLSDGLAAYKAKSYDEAMKLLTPIAEGGNPDAQYTVSLMYMLGYGTEENIEKGLEWRRKAAEQGHLDALRTLAFYYLSGLDGVKKDIPEAVKWLSMSADRGDSYAQAKLGELYTTGNGVKQDVEKGVAFYQTAAKNPKDPSSWAQFELGKMHETGLGLYQDFARAKIWYEMSAAEGNPDAYMGLGRLYEHGDSVMQDFVLAHKYYNLGTAYSDYSDSKEVAKIMYKVGNRMSLSQVNQAQDEAVAEYESKNEIGVSIDPGGKRAKAGQVNLQAFLGFSYLTGTEGVPQHYRRAMEWLTLSADRGNREAQLNLAGMYQNGLGVAPDMVQAYKWANIAASDQCEPYCGATGLLEEQARIRDQAKVLRDVLAPSMSPDELATAQEFSRAWHKAP